MSIIDGRDSGHETTTVVQRAKAEAERRWPMVNQPTFGPDDYMNMGARSGFEDGAAFAATITSEQIEAGARALRDGDEAYPDTYGDEDYRSMVRAAFRAAGFTIEGGRA